MKTGIQSFVKTWIQTQSTSGAAWAPDPHNHNLTASPALHTLSLSLSLSQRRLQHPAPIPAPSHSCSIPVWEEQQPDGNLLCAHVTARGNHPALSIPRTHTAVSQTSSSSGNSARPLVLQTLPSLFQMELQNHQANKIHFPSTQLLLIAGFIT